MIRYLFFICAVVLSFLSGCGASLGFAVKAVPKDAVIVEKESGYAYGADVSWITEMEAKGRKFYTPGENPVEMELMQLLRDYCNVNAVRLRVWVNPTDGWNNIDDVVLKTQRAEKLGLRTMIDFHLSDNWADPGKQVIPEAWKDLSFEDMKAALAAHVTDCLIALKSAGVNPEWVQIGNETTPGFMLPVGSVTDNPEGMTELNNAGYDAVKRVFPDAKVIVHLDCANDKWRYDRMFDALEANGGKYDMIGVSVYYYWAEQGGYDKGFQAYIDDCKTNIAYLKQKYSKPVMICEIGHLYDEPQVSKDLITGMLDADAEGIFYWEPESDPHHYKLGCFDNDTPTIALDAFKH